LERAATDGQGLAAEVAYWATAILCNGLGKYVEAAEAARACLSHGAGPFVASWVLPELIEAAARSGDDVAARSALDQLSAVTQASGTDWALGVEARCRATLSDGDADDLFRESINRLERAQLQPELARSHLMYGEWLRRQRLRSRAREHLRVADDMCAAIGMNGFGGRARRELTAMGLKVRQRRLDMRLQLTPQEEQIARLARDGLTNPEIGAMLFISARTVEWHLSHVFTKLGIRSRRALHSSLPSVHGEVDQGPAGD
jgi:DNA-binding CsgD family transcriptional regulator